MRLNIYSTLCIQEIYALENAGFNIAVYGPYKPYISCIHNMECLNATIASLFFIGVKRFTVPISSCIDLIFMVAPLIYYNQLLALALASLNFRFCNSL